ncbi:hypothetical protein [Euzebya tangerina]|uniref:hypothetical protein n=1 Tax=Euzebya tangerina TaxID=591198 RepID=UPI000E313779|nr:hypothetical protein [Euzebya tangerina]
MANITVSVPDAVYRSARIRAAERGTSVSAMVAEFLAGTDDRDAEFERLQALQGEVIAEVRAQGTAFSAADRLSREDVHHRAVR